MSQAIMIAIVSALSVYSVCKLMTIVEKAIKMKRELKTHKSVPLLLR